MAQTYLIYSSFHPNTAANNRALAYIRSMSVLHYKVTVLFLLPDEKFSQMTENMPYINVEYCWKNYYIKKKYLKNISYVLYLFNIYRRVRPDDIVYLYGNFDLMLLLTAKRGVRVYSEHTEHPLVHAPQGRLLKPSLKWFFKVCKKLEGLFVISTCLRDYFVENGFPSNKITIINSIVDTKRFEGLIKQATDVPYFAYCGNGNNRKDKVDELIKVFCRVSRRHKDLRLLIIGPTEQFYKEEQDNVQLVNKLGIEDKVIFTGLKPSSEIPQLLVNATALFLTRPNTLQNRAGFSTKLVEYLASRNPVVVAGVGDIPIYLKDRENAFVYNPDDFFMVEVIMEHILSHPDEAKAIGASGAEVARTYFNAVTETQKMIDAFNESDTKKTQTM